MSGSLKINFMKNFKLNIYVVTLLGAGFLGFLLNLHASPPLDGSSSAPSFPEISQSSRDRAKQILDGAGIVFVGGKFAREPGANQ